MEMELLERNELPMIRLIATDLDDTLLNEHGDISPRTLRALKAAMETGCGVTLSSGRMLEAMLPFAHQIGANAPMLMFNGAMVYDHRTDQTIFSPVIKEEIAHQILKMAEDMHLYIQAYPGKGYYCDEICEYTENYAKSVRVQPTAVHMPLSQWLKGDVVKMLIIDTPEGADKAQAAMRAAFSQGACFMKSRPHYVEIAPENVDKGYSLKILAEHLGIDRSEIIAFGDGQNDVSMLQYAGIGYAMANACVEARSCTSHIAPSNTEDGVAQVIEKHLINGDFGSLAG